MRSFSLMRNALTSDIRLPSLREQRDTMAAATFAISDMDTARMALTEADRVIRMQEEHIRRLEGLALTDELTGLLNRRGFTQALQRELALARRDLGASGVLIMADLDDFKSINDQLGHAAGDDYLRGAGRMLTASVRSSDIVARLGGDEFAVLCTRMSDDTGMKRLAKLEKAFNGGTALTGDKSLPLAASFGLTAYQGTDTPESIMAAADLKLYAHKARRRSSRVAS